MSGGPVFVIAVTHESGHAADALADGLARLREESPRRVDAVVVDNASTDDTVDRLRARGVDVVESPENRGWSAGNNLGLARLPNDAEHVLLLNPDVRVPADALERLAAPLDADPAVGAAVPRLRRPDGSLRSGALPAYDLADALLGVFGRRRWKVRRLARTIANGGAVVPLDGAYPEGGCLLLRRGALDAVGPFDERFFLFFDDADLGRRLAAAGSTAVLATAAIVDEAREKGSRAAPAGDAAEERIERYRRYLEAELRYYDKWWGRSAARRIARLRLAVDLPLQERRWRRRHGIAGVAARARPVVEAFLAERAGPSPVPPAAPTSTTSPNAPSEDPP